MIQGNKITSFHFKKNDNNFFKTEEDIIKNWNEWNGIYFTNIEELENFYKNISSLYLYIKENNINNENFSNWYWIGKN